jgi:antagonist of KipI
MSLEVISGGLLTTIQDLGRTGLQQFGVNVSGAMDPVGAQLANWLVGNEGHAALLELTLKGPELKFHAPALLALAGRDLGAKLDHKECPLWKPFLAPAGSTLSFSGPALGRFGYLAIRGGFKVEKVLGSCSTHLQAGFGGHMGRGLKAGDQLAFMPHKDSWNESWSIDAAGIVHNKNVMRVMRGPEWEGPADVDQLWGQTFTVTAASDRMGYRLQGSLAIKHQQEILSSGVSAGTIQLPPDGHPIVLMADRQTTGGYPRIGQVISADLPELAQRLPGDIVSFEVVSLQSAQEIYFKQMQLLQHLREALKLRWKTYE